MAIRYVVERDRTPGNLPLRLSWYETPEDITDKIYLIGAINSALLSLNSKELLDMETDVRIIPGLLTPTSRIVRTVSHLVIITFVRNGIHKMNVYDEQLRNDVTINLDTPTSRYLSECIPEELA